MNKNLATSLGLGLAAAVALTGCSSKASSSGSDGGGKGDIKTDFGVTDDTITLGVLTDLSGVFKAVGLNLTQGNQLWADKINADGGICGRDIEIATQDHGYKADSAVPLYEQSKGSIAGYIQLLGSPVVAALKSKLITDQMLSVIGTHSSILLDNDYLIIPGSGVRPWR